MTSATRATPPLSSRVDVMFVALGFGVGLHLGIRFWMCVVAWV